MKLVIDRSKWMRGTGSGMLRNSAGQMCCLGFCLLWQGAERDALIGEGLPTDYPTSRADGEWDAEDGCAEPGDLRDDLPWSWLFAYLADGYRLEDKFVAINDERGITEAEREEWLTAGFAQQGIDVEFVDGPGQP